VKRTEVLNLLAEHQGELARLGVKSLAVFGSVARDEASPNSDVDLLVEFEPAAVIGLFKFQDIQEYLERVLGRPVDLVARDALKRQLREQILGEAIPVTSRSPARG
jgi:predicted nucleotidyltransferase